MTSEGPSDTDRAEPGEAGEGVDRGYPGVADEVAMGTDAADAAGGEGGEGSVDRGYPGVAGEVAAGTSEVGVPPSPPATGGPAEPRVPVGFSSRLDYLDTMERSSALYTRISLEDRNFDRERMGLAPLSEDEINRTIREPQSRRGRQIGIKLSTRDYSRLVDAADLFGATPTTLARLLLNRAVTAVLSFEPERKAEPEG